MFEEIALEIKNAAANKDKTAMIHFQILINADRLVGVNAATFCERVGLAKSWEIEYPKMIKLAQTLKDHGLCIAKCWALPNAIRIFSTANSNPLFLSTLAVEV